MGSFASTPVNCLTARASLLARLKAIKSIEGSTLRPALQGAAEALWRSHSFEL